MASPSPGLDIEAQAISITETQPAIIPNSSPATNTVNNQLPTAADPQPQSTSINEHNNGNAGTKQTVDHSEVQHGVLTFPFHKLYCDLIYEPDENHGDSSDGIWSMYVNEAEKQDTEVIESWKGDTDGILVFVSLGPPSCVHSPSKAHVKDWSVFGYRRKLHYRKLSESVSRFQRHDQCTPYSNLSAACQHLQWDASH